jgi:hypothetical protein
MNQMNNGIISLIGEVFRVTTQASNPFTLSTPSLHVLLSLPLAHRNPTNKSAQYQSPQYY